MVDYALHNYVLKSAWIRQSIKQWVARQIRTFPHNVRMIRFLLSHMHRGTLHRRQRARSEPPLASAVNGGSGGGEAGVGLRPAIILYYEIILLKLEVRSTALGVSKPPAPSRWAGSRTAHHGHRHRPQHIIIIILLLLLLFGVPDLCFSKDFLREYSVCRASEILYI